VATVMAVAALLRRQTGTIYEVYGGAWDVRSFWAWSSWLPPTSSARSLLTRRSNQWVSSR
jgi:hypothetical protein